MFRLEGDDQGTIRKQGRGLVLVLTILSWLLAILIFPVYLMHGTQGGWFQWFVWGVTAILTTTYLLVLRKVVQIRKSTYIVIVRDGPKIHESAIGQFQGLRLEFKRTWPWPRHTAVLVGTTKDAEILNALSKTSLRRKAEPIAEWLNIPITHTGDNV